MIDRRDGLPPLPLPVVFPALAFRVPAQPEGKCGEEGESGRREGKARGSSQVSAPHGQGRGID